MSIYSQIHLITAHGRESLNVTCKHRADRPSTVQISVGVGLSDVCLTLTSEQFREVAEMCIAASEPQKVHA